MDINSQKETWFAFKKLAIYIAVAIILILGLMGFFLI
jgi:hypothetical protein